MGARRNLSAGFLAVCSCVFAFAGCEGDRAAAPTGEASAPPVPVAPATPPEGISASELRRRLGANENAQFQRTGGEITQVDLHDSGVTDLEGLRGLKLQALGISGLEVSDLSPLAGMPLELLTAEDTTVEDLSPLKGAPLAELYLRDSKVADLSPVASDPITMLNVVGTPVTDISAVKDMPLNTLWIGSTKVSDLSQLAGKQLESLDIEDTPIDDIGVLKGMTTLLRLNIAKTPVKDLSPLQGLSLQRLILTPPGVESGIEAVRSMESLREIGTNFESVMPAEEFWKQYDAGKFKGGDAR
jgi:Leucine-rich repeat (LRR) protein